MNVLFVTWDGPQVSYLESLFLPIFTSIMQDREFSFHVLQFSWASDSVVAHRRQVCEQNGCSYTSVSVIRKPVSIGALVSSLTGCRHIRKAIKNHSIDIVISRSTLPALSSLLALRGSDKHFVFDADGLPLDERVDFAGQSPLGIVYRILRDVEAQAVRRAKVVLTRSKQAVSILHARAGAGTFQEKFHVVSNGRDSSLFTPGLERDRYNVRTQLGIGLDAPLIVYAGSLGPQYRPDAMLELFGLIRQSRPDSHFLVLTGSPDLMNELISKNTHLLYGTTVMRVESHEVPIWISAADLGLAFREPTFSMQGVAPIKLGEYLLCGVPVVATRGVGDSHFIDDQSGLVVENSFSETLVAVSEWFIKQVLPRRNDFRERCRSVGLRHFSLESSVETYRKALESIQGKV
jgi:glycosyltransferase involved in cell wall biosynthesis